MITLEKKHAELHDFSPKDLQLSLLLKQNIIPCEALIHFFKYTF